MAQSIIVTLYSRQGCHLCEAAEAILLRCGVRPFVVDVDGDACLQARYSDLVPVVAIGGRDILKGVFSKEQARSALAEALGSACP